MSGFLIRRLAQGVISIVGASIVIFLISRLSGDPILILLPNDASPALIEDTRRNLGLDQPLWRQYLIFAQNALAGDFGRSYRWQMPALRLILDRLPATIELALCGLVFSVVKLAETVAELAPGDVELKALCHFGVGVAGAGQR